MNKKNLTANIYQLVFQTVFIPRLLLSISMTITLKYEQHVYFVKFNGVQKKLPPSLASLGI